MKLRRVLTLTLASTVMALAAPGVVLADDCDKAPAVNLNAISSDDVENDMVRLNWQVQVQAGSANEAMSAVNSVLEKSITNLSGIKEISRLKNNLQTYPQYGKDRKIQLWQGVGTLTFEMPVQALKNRKSLNVADGLALSNLEYFASDALVQKTRQQLLDRAIREFQDKASLVAKGFGKTTYTLGEVSINDENQQGAPIHARMYAASADVMAKGVEVAQAAGSSRLSVSVNGRVCLKP